MNLLHDLQAVSDGDTPASILALIQPGYVVIPPAMLTTEGASILRELRTEGSDGIEAPDDTGTPTTT